MKLGLLSASVIVGAFVLAGCQHQDAAPPPAASLAPPPTLTSAPLPPPPAPPPPPPHSHADEHVYRLDFVLTPKDPQEPTLSRTSFSLNIVDHNSGEVRVGKNVALTPVQPPMPPPGDKNAAALHPGGVARMDVGIKVKAHPQTIDASSDILIDVDLELSSLESNGAIRKVTSEGAVVATPGKSALVVSLDDDKRHYDLTVTPTKIR